MLNRVCMCSVVCISTVCSYAYIVSEALASYVTEACMHAFIFYTIMILMNSWLTELAHHEASVGYHKTVIIAGTKQVTITLRCSL